MMQRVKKGFKNGFASIEPKSILICTLILTGCQSASETNEAWINGTIHAEDHQPVTIELSGESKRLTLIRRPSKMEKCRIETNDKYAKNILLSNDVIIDPGKGISGQFQGVFDHDKDEFILTCARELDGYQIYN